MNGKNDWSKRDADEFWDISALVPPRRKTPKTRPVTRDTQAVEITAPPRGVSTYRVEDAVMREHYVTPPAPEERVEPEYVYAPTGSLLHEVRVYSWRSHYEYYESFRAHARALYSKEGKRADPIGFFSYMPQYVQMNEAQLAYYLFWRSEFRKGNYLAADYSYLLLFAYELINVSDVVPPLDVQDAMLRLWLNYRAAHPRLDALLREWLCDHALLYRLPAPRLPAKEFRDMISGARLKEYYVPMGETDDALTGAVLHFCNNYDYTKSKFFKEETAEDYHRVLRGALGIAISYLRERDGNVLTGGSGMSTISRDAFTGAICSYHLKRRIEVDYTSFSHTHELRYIMSDVLKYAENALRAAWGIKSRLSIFAVEVPLRERLDAYLVHAVPSKSRANAKKEEIPDYEKRYEIPVREVSVSRAAEIEAASWQTTKRLVEAFEEEKCPNGTTFEGEKSQALIAVPVTEKVQDGLAAALGELCALVQLCDMGDVKGQRDFARAKGRMLDALVDEINTVAADMLGDIILEEADGGFAVIGDYREELSSEGVL